jgi:hypothetical protein
VQAADTGAVGGAAGEGAFIGNEGGCRVYAKRTGIEGTISQGMRSFGLRRAGYSGRAKAHLQHVAMAVAINLDGIDNGQEGVPGAGTRTSRFGAEAEVSDPSIRPSRAPRTQRLGRKLAALAQYWPGRVAPAVHGP